MHVSEAHSMCRDEHNAFRVGVSCCRWLRMFGVCSLCLRGTGDASILYTVPMCDHIILMAPFEQLSIMDGSIAFGLW